MATIGELKAGAAQLFSQGQHLDAMRLYHAILLTAPLEYEARLRVADCLQAAGAAKEAVDVYRATAWYCLRSGHPLVTLVIARVLQEALGQEVDDLLTALVVHYGSESELVGKFAARVNAPDPNLQIPPAPELGDADVVAAAAAWAKTCTDDFDGYPEYLHGIPLLSGLSEAAFKRVLGTLVVGRVPLGARVISEGEPGTSFFFLATGRLRVYDTDSLSRQRDLARLGENAVFGEMALLSARPRSASVEVTSPEADLLEVTSESLRALADELPAVANALHHFTMDRLLSNLMARSPLFRPFTRAQQRDLLKRFTSHDVASGTAVIREGEEGQGLFVLVSGAVEVSTDSGVRANTELATLRAGDVFGEMSLMKKGPTTATVTACEPTTVLFLDREYVQRMVENVPEIRTYLSALAEDRRLETELVIADDVEEDDGSVVILF
jgi:cAMP-dependent protein kinase regulator